MPRPHRYTHNITPIPNPREHGRQGRRKIVTAKGPRNLPDALSSRNDREPPDYMNKENTNNGQCGQRTSLQGSSQTENYRLREGKLVFPREELPSWLYRTKVSLEIIHIQATLTGLNRRYTCICACDCVTIFFFKETMNSRRSNGWHGRGWRKKRSEENDVTIFSFNFFQQIVLRKQGVHL